MSERAPHPEQSDAEGLRRCPHCDSVVAAEATQCRMCGAVLPPAPAADAAAPQEEAAAETAVSAPQPAVAETPLPETPETTPTAPPAPSAAGDGPVWKRPSFLIILLLGVAGVFLFAAGVLLLRDDDAAETAAVDPAETAVSPTSGPRITATWTPIPTETATPSPIPSATPTPQPTATLRPPRTHTVSGGETLFGLALRYRVAPDVIAATNNFAPDVGLQVNQELLIPWPTPTPPLEPVAVEINGETVLADPTDCERYEVRAGDSLSSIAARYDIDFDLFLRVNRLDQDFVLQPGDTVCIPEIQYGVSLPPTPGPSPTPSPTPPLPGPNLLYPVEGSDVSPPDGVLRLQWAAVKDLAEDEWYMAEVVDLDNPDQPPYRAFTRDTAVQVPASWRPDVAETHLFRWRVSIVQVTGERSDGRFLYTYGGESSDPHTFTWLGAVPTPTPTATPTATPTVPPPTATPQG